MQDEAAESPATGSLPSSIITQKMDMFELVGKQRQIHNLETSYRIDLFNFKA